jgi:hypothetical protein
MSGTCVPRPPKSPPYRSAAEIAEDIPPPYCTPWYVKVPYYSVLAVIVAFFGWSVGDTWGESKGRKEGMRDASGACRDEVIIGWKPETSGPKCSHPDQVGRVERAVSYFGEQPVNGFVCSCPRR